MNVIARESSSSVGAASSRYVRCDGTEKELTPKQGNYIRALLAYCHILVFLYENLKSMHETLEHRRQGMNILEVIANRLGLMCADNEAKRNAFRA